VKPLIAGAAEKEREWVARGIYPINHTVVIKDELLAAHPGIGAALYRAFVEAKQPFTARLAAGGELSAEDQALASRRDLVGPDPIPYGIEANRETLEAIVSFAKAQHILTKDVPVEDLFVPGFAQFVGSPPPNVLSVSQRQV
jgi:4,5-dihydroxyphthalate decarboxylase